MINNPETLESILRARIEKAQADAARHVDAILLLKHKLNMAELDEQIAKLALDQLQSKV